MAIDITNLEVVISDQISNMTTATETKEILLTSKSIEALLKPGAGYTDKTISLSTLLDDNTFYETGKNLVVNTVATLIVPNTSLLVIRTYSNSNLL
jgi:hypothetical protein